MPHCKHISNDNPLVKILMRRDSMTLEDAKHAVFEGQEMVEDGTSPEEVLHYEFGLEPDYIFDLLEGW